MLPQIAVLWEANDLGFPVKEFVETLEGIRIGVVSQGDEPGVIVESRTKRQAELAARFRLTDMLPVLNEVTAQGRSAFVQRPCVSREEIDPPR